MNSAGIHHQHGVDRRLDDPQRDGHEVRRLEAGAGRAPVLFLITLALIAGIIMR